MEVNYEDKRFEQVEADKNAAMNQIDQTYGNMIDQSDSFYQQKIEASKQWADTQSQLQQDQTDFTIEQIEQQKAQAQKDYTKEQSGAYVDWKKQSQQHGVNAEQMASAGMTNTGFSESSQVSMYNTYQNRVATAREVFSQAVLAYDNNIKEARLQNNAVLAEIAFQSLQQQLELSLQGFQYKNQLILDQTNKKLEVDNMYYSRYQDVLDQINHENAFAEEVRQWNESMDFEKEKFDESTRQWNESIALEREKFDESTRQWNESMAMEREKFDESIRQYNESITLERKKFDESIRQYEEEIARLKANDEIANKATIERLEMEKAAMEEDKRRWEEEMSLEYVKLLETIRQFNVTHKDETGGSSSNTPVDNRNELGLAKEDLTDKAIAAMIYGGKLDLTVDEKTSQITYTWASPAAKKEYELMLSNPANQ